MFNSPTAFCPVCRDWIALDEPLAPCAAHPDCTFFPCPLQALAAAPAPADARRTRDPGAVPLATAQADGARVAAGSRADAVVGSR